MHHAHPCSTIAMTIPNLHLPEGLGSQTALDSERTFLLRHVGFDKTIVRAEGCDLFDSEGTHYLDALAQCGALPFGHNPEFLWRRIFALQAAREPGFVLPLRNSGAEPLAQQL